MNDEVLIQQTTLMYLPTRHHSLNKFQPSLLRLQQPPDRRVTCKATHRPRGTGKAGRHGTAGRQDGRQDGRHAWAEDNTENREYQC